MNGRKTRQLRAQGGQKRLRRFRKDVRAAEDAVRADKAEAEAVWQEQYAEAVAALAEEPQFAIVNPFNGETLVVAAQSMIWPLGVNGRGEPLDEQPAEKADPLSDPTSGQGEFAAAGLSGYNETDTQPALPQVILPGTAAALGIEAP